MLDDNGALPIFDRLRMAPARSRRHYCKPSTCSGSTKGPPPPADREAQGSANEAASNEAKVPRQNGRTGAIHDVDHLDLDDGALIFENACALGCEGIVSKLKGSRYTSGRGQESERAMG